MDTKFLPGSDLVEQGLEDLRLGKKTETALLVSIGHPKLRSLGFNVPQPFPNPEMQLYERLSSIHGDNAHSKYNALIRRLVSFERAAARAQSHASNQ